ncbi:MAG: tRNA dihydrouridine synthase DusB, partial [Candidatus Nanopelagicales bacterium]|nr:tRNA dihydrouridine synthase DusB [Candidatus Nanopelagicales bacterium]
DPHFDKVLRTLRRHAQLLCVDYGEARGCRDMRKHMAWYLKGFSVKQQIRQSLGTVSSLAELDDLIGQINGNQDFNCEVGAGPRGRTSGGRRPILPEGWLDSPFIDDIAASNLLEAELSVSGG